MQRPIAPSINIEDTEQGQQRAPTTPRSDQSPRSQPETADDEPWRQPSIRIRRQTVQRARATSVATAGNRQSSGSSAEYRGVRHSSVAAGPGAAPPTPGTDGFLTVETFSSPASRPRGGSGSNRQLRHENSTSTVSEADGGRRRSSSDPPPPANREALPGSRGQRNSAYMPPLEEGTVTLDVPQRPQNAVLQQHNLGDVDQNVEHPGYFGVGRRLSNAAGQTYSRFFPTLSTVTTTYVDPREEQYEADMVDVLDTLDPEVSTLNTLTNVQNSLFVPDLGRYLNRRPTYNLSSRAPTSTYASTIREEPAVEEAAEEIVEEEEGIRRRNTVTSMSSRLDDLHFAVLPHGERLEGWTAEDRAELNDHVRHLLHSRKEKFKRSMKGFGQYVKKPLGFFVTVYATLITLFGLAWVLFLIGWISIGARTDYIINIIDNVLVALFAIIGDGLAPFRAVDTYHMCFIAHYHHLTWRLRRERALPKLQNRNDLPDLAPSWDQTDAEVGDDKEEDKQGEYSVLSPKQQRRLVHHQKKFSRSHTFYKPHATPTHFAFPLRLLVAVVVLLDCHSLLQIALGTCTWAISYHHRPFALTTVILCCSITCNITAGVLISVGDHKTRKKDVLERMFRQELTSQAISMLEKKKQKERERNGPLEASASTLTVPGRMKERGRERDETLAVSTATLTVPGQMDEKEKEAGVLATGSEGAAGAVMDVDGWASAQEHKRQPSNPSTNTTTTITGPTVTTTTMTRSGY